MKFVKMFAGSTIWTWLSERLLHVPDQELSGAALEAGVTPEQYRAVEAVQARRALVFWNKI